MHINQNLCRINFGTEEVILVKEIENHSEKNLPNDKIDISLSDKNLENDEERFQIVVILNNFCLLFQKDEL